MVTDADLELHVKALLVRVEHHYQFMCLHIQ